MCEGSDHDRGLGYDLQVLFKRRQFLQLGIAAGATGLLTGCDWMPGMSEAQADKVAKAADGSQCVLHTTETAGPYPADGSNNAHGTLANVLDDSGVQREDMRFDIGNGGDPAPGQMLKLDIRLVNVNRSCEPLPGHAVYLWHCDAEGRYSIYDLQDRSYLRGVRVSDSAGRLSFTTIVPGCYRGRYPHMHFEVYESLEKAADYKNRILTSQLAVPAETCQAVYGGNPAYATSLENFRESPLESDGIFRDNTPIQLAAQTIEMGNLSSDGFSGSVLVGLDV